MARDFCPGRLLIDEWLLHAEFGACGFEQDVAVWSEAHRVRPRYFETQSVKIGVGRDAQVVFDAVVVAVHHDADARRCIRRAGLSEVRNVRAPEARIVAEEVVCFAAKSFIAAPGETWRTGEAHGYGAGRV